MNGRSTRLSTRSLFGSSRVFYAAVSVLYTSHFVEQTIKVVNCNGFSNGYTRYIQYTRKLSVDVLFPRSVSALKPDTARRVESMIGIILLRSGLLYLPGFMILRKDYDCMLDEIVRPG